MGELCAVTITTLRSTNWPGYPPAAQSTSVGCCCSIPLTGGNSLRHQLLEMV